MMGPARSAPGPHPPPLETDVAPAPRTGRPYGTPRRALLGAGLGLLAGAAAGCAGRPGPWPGLRLATGPEGGPYNAFGRALATAAARSGVPAPILPVATAASVDNLRELDRGSVELALAMADTAEDAVRGREDFSRPVAVTALARVYVNHTHLVVAAGGPVRTMGDLAGRPVATGAEGSGVRVVARRVLRAAGLTTGPAAVRERPLGLGESVTALRSGTVDALFWSGGVPTPALAALARETPVRLLPLDGWVDALREHHAPVYSAVTLPAGAYGQTGPVGTIGVGNYLLARADVAAPAVRDLLGAIFGQWRDLLRDVTAGARLEPRFAISTGSVPLHPGATEYYRSVYG
ncbi:TAXI family TRAP transporter solute-binding subunit [Streptomyces sp. JL4002]|uniref:TAXI family TRAP transporter solute-binding subunit n=1 Tax=Streptomyces sp. JL4002 TaxID=3404781 RepID=UPI003B28D609